VSSFFIFIPIYTPSMGFTVPDEAMREEGPTRGISEWDDSGNLFRPRSGDRHLWSRRL
jgi:hypothetical protein